MEKENIIDYSNSDSANEENDNQYSHATETISRMPSENPDFCHTLSENKRKIMKKCFSEYFSYKILKNYQCGYYEITIIQILQAKKKKFQFLNKKEVQIKHGHIDPLYDSFHTFLNMSFVCEFYFEFICEKQKQNYCLLLQEPYTKTLEFIHRPFSLNEIINFFKKSLFVFSVFQQEKFVYNNVTPKCIVVFEENGKITSYQIDNFDFAFKLTDPQPKHNFFSCYCDQRYFSPEKLEIYNSKNIPTDFNYYKSDVFSFGLILLQMYFGEPNLFNDRVKMKSNFFFLYKYLN